MFFSLSLSPSFPLSLKSVSMSLGEDKKNGRNKYGNHLDNLDKVLEWREKWIFKNNLSI